MSICYRRNDNDFCMKRNGLGFRRGRNSNQFGQCRFSDERPMYGWNRPNCRMFAFVCNEEDVLERSRFNQYSAARRNRFSEESGRTSRSEEILEKKLNAAKKRVLRLEEEKAFLYNSQNRENRRIRFR